MGPTPVVNCPICNKGVVAADINSHIDSRCLTSIAPSASTQSPPLTAAASSQAAKRSASSFFQAPSAKRQAISSTAAPVPDSSQSVPPSSPVPTAAVAGKKRSFGDGPGEGEDGGHDDGDIRTQNGSGPDAVTSVAQAAKRPKTAGGPSHAALTAPLAERMRPKCLDEVAGQDLVGQDGVLRAIVEGAVAAGPAHCPLPSMILWGAAGTGKTTIARCIAARARARFVELSAASSGVAECRRLFAEAANELALVHRRTVVFCDEIHRFSKTQQDVFLAPVEAGIISLIGATTENPSFRVQAALLSRCRTFTLQKLAPDDLVLILSRAMDRERVRRQAQNQYQHQHQQRQQQQQQQQRPVERNGVSPLRTDAAAATTRTEDADSEEDAVEGRISSIVDADFLAFLAAFSDGDARTALNLLEMALSLASRAGMTGESIKAALTKHLVYDRHGDQHFDAISAFQKAVRGGDADAVLYYLARMLQSGEDPAFIARRMVVIASEDVGLADGSLLPLATAAFAAVQQVGMPEARIPLAHCAVALALAPKSTRIYRGLNAALAALAEPGVAALPIPLHLRNAPTRLLRELGCGALYKYPPNYRDGRVRQTYLPDQLVGRRFLGDLDLGTEIDPDVDMVD